ncbi:hypothetical protein F8280_33350 [Micromonospora noduli]|uniref:hypothetical protein n=1 Tax=Micromonospora noduli TaxID=709876 RepID=UPI00124B0230|nr:hypothetical protein [Micromonospora noduli]KAB1912367.1 hypothetical protein F8280_33350 [Micromonospora noduli]
MTPRYARELPACAHVEIGANLQAAHEFLVHLAVDLANTYGKSTRQAREANKALQAVDQLRNVLDGVSAGEMPGDRWSTSIYYGANEDVRQGEIQRVMEEHWANNPNCPCITDNG